jgi:hypothetical protein
MPGHAESPSPGFEPYSPLFWQCKMDGSPTGCPSLRQFVMPLETLLSDVSAR